MWRTFIYPQRFHERPTSYSSLPSTSWCFRCGRLHSRMERDNHFNQYCVVIIAIVTKLCERNAIEHIYVPSSLQTDVWLMVRCIVLTLMSETIANAVVTYLLDIDKGKVVGEHCPGVIQHRNTMNFWCLGYLSQVSALCCWAMASIARIFTYLYILY